jgi:uncharacterized membrane protein YhaH (DUF805 family)
MDIKWLLFSFEGRLNRQPYWLVVIIMAVLNSGLSGFTGGFDGALPAAGGQGLLAMAATILSIWIGLAVQIKRWHDRDKSGWWALLNLVPIIGWIWIFIECGFLRGSFGDNRFGRDQLARTE